MTLAFYQGAEPNFGDDLNAELWRRLLPAELIDRPDLVLVGIGSILNASILPAWLCADKKIFVLGAGAGYAPLPIGWRGDNFSFLAVRGPLTAAVIGQPQAAATDAAALLLRTPDLLRPKPVERGKRAALMMHHKSLADGDWERVARLAGVDYIDPRWPIDRVLTALAEARLVITEAMHGAIVADVLRTPWLPIFTSPELVPFKWRDWTSSLELPFETVPVPPSTVAEGLRHRATRRALAAGFGAPAGLAFADDAGLISDFEARYGGDQVHVETSHAAAVARQNALKRSARDFLGFADPMLALRAAQAVSKLAASKGFLSEDRVLERQTQKLEDAVEAFRVKASG